MYRANSLRELTLKFFARSSTRTEKGMFVKFLYLDLCFQRLIICGADMTTALLPLGSPGCSRYRINIERQLKVNSAHLKNQKQIFVSIPYVEVVLQPQNALKSDC